jgi:hypothetical protein
VKTQKHGVFEFGSCRSNLFANNHCRGNARPAWCWRARAAIRAAMWIEGGAQDRRSDSESGPLWGAPEAAVFKATPRTATFSKLRKVQIVKNGVFLGVSAWGGAGPENWCRGCARRSDRPKHRRAPLRASVSSARSAQVPRKRSVRSDPGKECLRGRAASRT